MAHGHSIIHFPSCPAKGHRGACTGCEWKRYKYSALIALCIGVLEYLASKYQLRIASGKGDGLHQLADFLQSAVNWRIAYLAIGHAQEARRRRIGAYIQSAGFLVVTFLIANEALAHQEEMRHPLQVVFLGVVTTAGAALRFGIVHPHAHFGRTVREIITGLLRRGRVNITQIAEILHVFLDFATSIAVLIVGLDGYLTGASTLDVMTALYFIAPCAFLSAIVVFFLALHHD